MEEMQVRDAGQQSDSHCNHAKLTQELMAEGSGPGESRTQPRQLAYSPDAPPPPPGPAHPPPPCPVRGTGTPVPPHVHPAGRSQGAGAWKGCFSIQQMLWLLVALPRGRDPGGARGQKPVTGFPFCPSSCFPSPPLFAHHREVTPTTSTYCSH